MRTFLGTFARPTGEEELSLGFPALGILMVISAVTLSKLVETEDSKESRRKGQRKIDFQLHF